MAATATATGFTWLDFSDRADLLTRTEVELLAGALRYADVRDDAAKADRAQSGLRAFALRYAQAMLLEERTATKDDEVRDLLQQAAEQLGVLATEQAP